MCRGVGISASERDGVSVVDLGYEAFAKEAVGVGEGGGSDVGKGAVMWCARGCGAGSVLAAMNRVEAEGKEDGVRIPLSPSLAPSGVLGFFAFFLVPRPEPAAAAEVWVVFGAYSGRRMAVVNEAWFYPPAWYCFTSQEWGNALAYSWWLPNIILRRVL